MAKYCANCGNLLDDGDKFCGNCGAPVEENPAPAKTVVTPAAKAADNGKAAAENKKENTAVEKKIEEDKKVEKAKAPSLDSGLYSSLLQKTSYSPSKDRTLTDKYFSYSGRLNRKRYFLRSLALWLAGIFFGGILTALFVPAGLVFTVILLLSSLLLSIRRLHDLNKSGWFVLINLIPVLNFFWGLYLLFAKGTNGTNEYGPDPLADQPQDFDDF